MKKVVLAVSVVLGLASCEKTCKCDLITLENRVEINRTTLIEENLCDYDGEVFSRTVQGNYELLQVIDNCQKLK